MCVYRSPVWDQHKTLVQYIVQFVLIPYGTFRVCQLPHSCITPLYSLSTGSLYCTFLPIVSACFEYCFSTNAVLEQWAVYSFLFRNFPCMSLSHTGSTCHTSVANHGSDFVYYFSTYSALAQQLAVYSFLLELSALYV